MTKWHEREDAILAHMSTEFWVTTKHLLEQGAAPTVPVINATLRNLERKGIVESKQINGSTSDGVKLPGKAYFGKIQVWKKV